MLSLINLPFGICASEADTTTDVSFHDVLSVNDITLHNTVYTLDINGSTITDINEGEYKGGLKIDIGKVNTTTKTLALTTTEFANDRDLLPGPNTGLIN